MLGRCAHHTHVEVGGAGIDGIWHGQHFRPERKPGFGVPQQQRARLERKAGRQRHCRLQFHTAAEHADGLVCVRAAKRQLGPPNTRKSRKRRPAGQQSWPVELVNPWRYRTVRTAVNAISNAAVIEHRSKCLGWGGRVGGSTRNRDRPKQAGRCNWNEGGHVPETRDAAGTDPFAAPGCGATKPSCARRAATRGAVQYPGPSACGQRRGAVGDVGDRWLGPRGESGSRASPNPQKALNKRPRK